MDRGVQRLTSIRLRGRHATVDRYRVEDAARPFACTYPMGDRAIALPVAEFRNNATWAVVKGIHGEESFGLLLRDAYCDGQLWTLAVPDAFPDLYHLPAEALSRVRQAMPVNGVWLEGPARISLFVYDNDSFVVYPYVMEGVQRETVRLHVKGAKALALPCEGNRWIEPLYCRDEESVFEVQAVPGTFVLYKIERGACAHAPRSCFHGTYERNGLLKIRNFPSFFSHAIDRGGQDCYNYPWLLKSSVP